MGGLDGPLISVLWLFVSIGSGHVFNFPNAMNAAEITDKFGLHSLRQRHWYIQSTCAASGEGLYEGPTTLLTRLKRWVNFCSVLVSILLQFGNIVRLFGVGGFLIL